MRDRLLHALMLLSWMASATGDFNLTVLHTNDIHCRFEEANKYGSTCTEEEAGAGKCYGGYARLVHQLKEIRRKDPNVIYVHGGDFFQGTIWYTIHKWKVVSHFTNYLNLTAMSLGNHEFDDGIDGLVPFIDAANFPVLAANVDTTDEQRIDGRVLPSITVQVQGRQIGIIGYVTQETAQISSPENVRIWDEVEGVRREAEKLKRRGVDILIAVGHAGYLKDLQVAKEVPDIDLVVGGHTNTFLWNGVGPSIEESQGPYPTMVQQVSGRRVPVVQAYAFGKYLGNLLVTFDDDGEVVATSGEPILLDHTIPQDREVLQELVPWKETIDGVSQTEVGTTNVFLDGSRLSCRMKECNIGNFITDAFVDQFLKFAPEGQWGKVAIAIVNGGGIRDSIDERSRNGSITYGDLRGVAPFPNTLDLVKVSGQTLIDLFEYAVHDYDTSALDPFGGFLQVSGIKVVFDLTQPAYQRVAEMMTRCSQCRVPAYSHVVRNETYDVATTSFIVGGGDGNNAFKDNLIEHQIIGMLDSDAIADYMAKMKPITIGTEQRIRFLDHNDRSACTNRRVDVQPSPSGSQSGSGSDSTLLNASSSLNAMVLLLSAWRMA